MSDAILAQFTTKLQEAGLLVERIEADGQLHRCGTIDKPHSKNGAYKAFLDEPPTVWWLNWATGDFDTHCVTPEKQLTVAEQEIIKQRAAQARAERKRLDDERHAEAAQRAQGIWSRAIPATDAHPYLTRKGVPALGLHLAWDGRLVLPVMDATGKVVSVQFINNSGEKRFLTGGRKAGGYFPLPAKSGDKSGPLLLAEGFATAATLHESTGFSVLVAFDAGNLKAVATFARAKYPSRGIILAADNDASTDGNPGVKFATAAAQAIGAKLAICPLIDGKPSDFNDLYKSQGLDAVRACIEAARKQDNPCPMPSGFSLIQEGKRAGLYCIEVKPDGDLNEVRLGPPLFVKGMTRDSDGNAWGLLLQWQDPDGRPHTWAMPSALLSKQGAE